jgi:hypothetical protein
MPRMRSEGASRRVGEVEQVTKRKSKTGEDIKRGRGSEDFWIE